MSRGPRRLIPQQHNPMKPFGHKCYGSIMHLPGSQTGPGDYFASEGQTRICCRQQRDDEDLIVVQEKLDGTNVGVAKIEGEIAPLIRAGNRTSASHYEMHHFFHEWALKHRSRFDDLLSEGERCAGEWLMQAHGTRYALAHEPFVAVDLMRHHIRLPFAEVARRCQAQGFTTPRVIHVGNSISVEDVIPNREPSGHGAIDPVEGAVWRVERNGFVEFLAKYVRPGHKLGNYFPETSGEPAVWNWLSFPRASKIFYSPALYL